VRVHVAIGAPIARRPDEDRGALIDRVRDEMAGVLARRRAAETGESVAARVESPANG
jgi:hypothetical protein